VRPELESVATEVHRRPYEEGDLEGAYLAFAATDAREVNSAVAEEAKGRGIPVNVADRPSEGDFALPATLRRGRLQVAVSTGGASPALAREVKGELEELFGPEWTGVVEELHAARRRGSPAGQELEGEVSRCLSRLRG
jgi:precorrin-2 dehydrogenase / sirohydrochlorin ferrochelatase